MTSKLKQFKLTKVELRSFFILWAACLVANILLIPYASTLLNLPEISWIKKVVGAILNGLILYPIPIFLGLLFKKHLPVAGLPVLEGVKPFALKDFIIYGILTGIFATFLILLFEFYFIQVSPEVKILNQKAPGLLEGFLASFYGAVVEEVLLRLFLLSVLLMFFKRFKIVGIWTAIILVAFIFGLGHLPATVQALDLPAFSALSWILITRAILLNGMVGILCGWLYWKKGLEYAMVCHFTVDLGLHVILPIFL